MKESGFSLIEIMMSLMIFSLTMIGLNRLQWESYGMCFKALKNTIAVNERLNTNGHGN